MLRMASVGVPSGSAAARWQSPARTLGLAAVAALAIGALSAAATPLAVAGALFGLLALAVVWWRPAGGVFLFVAVIAVLPFGVIPVQVEVQLTLVDAVLIATFSAVLVKLILTTPTHERVSISAASVLMVAFVLVAVAAFLAGSAATPVPPELIRRFAKLLASSLFFVLVRRLITGPELVERLMRWLIIAGGVQGAIGAGLMALSPTTQLTLLRSLGPIGYPTSDVLRYVAGPNDTYTSQLRAIGTSIDPNVFGGTLMLPLLLIVAQGLAPRPVMPRSLLFVLAVPTLAGVVLSLSRASWVGLVAGLLVVGLLRYRRLLLVAAVGLLVVLVLPVGQDLVQRFVSGLSVADRATAFRVGEYANALTLIQRYPLLGIGFGLSPDIDVTAGVSSVYLLVAEQTGLLGLGLYLATLGVVTWTGVRRVVRAEDPRLDSVVAGFLAAVAGALVAGLLDHYFANQAFPHAVALFWLYAAGLLAASSAFGEGVALPKVRGASLPGGS